MEFKVEKKSIRVTIDDKSYEMKVPSVVQQMEAREKLAAEGPEKSIPIIISYFELLGLPREVINGLDYDTFLDLYGFIHSSKKN